MTNLSVASAIKVLITIEQPVKALCGSGFVIRNENLLFAEVCSSCFDVLERSMLRQAIFIRRKCIAVRDCRNEAWQMIMKKIKKNWYTDWYTDSRMGTYAMHMEGLHLYENAQATDHDWVDVDRYLSSSSRMAVNARPRPTHFAQTIRQWHLILFVIRPWPQKLNCTGMRKHRHLMRSALSIPILAVREAYGCLSTRLMQNTHPWKQCSAKHAQMHAANTSSAFVLSCMA